MNDYLLYVILGWFLSELSALSTSAFNYLNERSWAYKAVRKMFK